MFVYIYVVVYIFMFVKAWTLEEGYASSCFDRLPEKE